MDLHVFPVLNPPPTSLSLPSLWVFPVHQPRALVSCNKPGLAICFIYGNIHVSMLFPQIIPLALLMVGKDLWRGFLDDSVVRNPPANAGDTGLIPGSGRSPGEGNGFPLQYTCLGNVVDRGPWQATVHGVTNESEMT